MHAYINLMNRRQFTLGLGAIVATPAVPVASLLKPTAVTAAASKHFFLAKLLARAHNNCSNAMLMRHLKVDAGMAAEVEQLLLNKNVITLPNIEGFSRAVNPMNINCVPMEGLKAPNIVNTVSDAAEKVKKVFTEDEAEEEVSSESEAEVADTEIEEIDVKQTSPEETLET
jgi:hypothetical protein